MSVNISADDDLTGSIRRTPTRKVRSQTFSPSGLPSTTREPGPRGGTVETTLGDSVANLISKL